MRRRGLFAHAKQAAFTELENKAWFTFMQGQSHACRTAEDWADLYATICHPKRSLMQRNGVDITAQARRQRIMQHL